MGAFGPSDHTEIGGVKGEFNSDETDENQPIERNSPVKVRVPGWREFVLAGSGGIYAEHS
jgi:hypothetical protein